MNLKDRLPQGKNVSVQIRNPGNLTDAMPISKQPSREQELSLKNENLKALSDELHKQVNLSNVEAVISAQNLVFFTIQLLGQLIIQAGDVMFRHGRHWRKWLDTKTL